MPFILNRPTSALKLLRIRSRSKGKEIHQIKHQWTFARKTIKTCIFIVSMLVLVLPVAHVSQWKKKVHQHWYFGRVCYFLTMRTKTTNFSWILSSITVLLTLHTARLENHATSCGIFCIWWCLRMIWMAHGCECVRTAVRSCKTLSIVFHLWRTIPTSNVRIHRYIRSCCFIDTMVWVDQEIESRNERGLGIINVIISSLYLIFGLLKASYFIYQITNSISDL